LFAFAVGGCIDYGLQYLSEQGLREGGASAGSLGDAPLAALELLAIGSTGAGGYFKSEATLNLGAAADGSGVAVSVHPAGPTQVVVRVAPPVLTLAEGDDKRVAKSKSAGDAKDATKDGGGGKGARSKATAQEPAPSAATKAAKMPKPSTKPLGQTPTKMASPAAAQPAGTPVKLSSTPAKSAPVASPKHTVNASIVVLSESSVKLGIRVF